VDLPHYVSGAVHDVDAAEFARLLGHPIPAEPTMGQELTPESLIGDIGSARSGLARLVYRFLGRRMNRAEANGTVELNLLFIFNLPFRQLAKVTGGMVDSAVVAGVLRIANGHFCSGLAAVLRAFFNNRKANKHTALLLAAGGDEETS
jgi:beta-glucosidase